VPDIAGRSITDAGQTLGDLGLVLRVDPLRRSDPEVPADHVVSQDPAPGAVIRRQRAVRVRLSDGHRSPAIPDLIGRPERTAEATLAEDEILVASRAEIRTTDYPTDTVIAQDPPGDGRGSSISLLVNRGERSSSYVVPDLIGTFGDQATAVLRARGFRVTIVAEVSYPGLPPGVVVRQTPEPGFRISFGEAISLEVSR
jgi:serine/threonine-protein kinase